MLICGIDPGLDSPGFAVWDTCAGRHVYVGSSAPTFGVDVAVVESGFIGRIGKLGMWGLGFRACWQLRDVQTDVRYTIRPDGKTGWRAALPLKPGSFQTYYGNDKAVIVNRLRHRYQMRNPEDGAWTDDMVEACGIAEAAAAILARPTRRSRQALKPVRFG